tara:strand:- start:1418 stop:1900 length:483 start_codon:yes stop_codon:yes gene_type:complete
MKDIFIEKATENHSKLIWEWRNDEESRKMSLNSNFITWEEHQNWFNNILKDINTFIYIGKFKNKIIGVIRFNKSEKDLDFFKVNINIAPYLRGQGFGKQLLKNAINKFSQENKNANLLKAEIKVNNKKSKHIFLKAGFTELKNYSNKLKILEFKISRDFQ